MSAPQDEGLLIDAQDKIEQTRWPIKGLLLIGQGLVDQYGVALLHVSGGVHQDRQRGRAEADPIAQRH
jgi:hypothetical protein